MRQKPRINMKQSGQMLIQVIVAFALMSVLALVLAKVMTDQNQQVKLLRSKQESIEVKNALLRTLISGTCCPMGTAALGDLVVTGVTTMNINNIYEVCPNAIVASPNVIYKSGAEISKTSDLVIQSIKILGINLVATNKYHGSFELKFQQKDATQMNLAPLRMDMELITDATNKVKSCAAIGSGGGGGTTLSPCPTGQFLTGEIDSSTGVPKCAVPVSVYQ